MGAKAFVVRYRTRILVAAFIMFMLLRIFVIKA
jgi:hypothetical protein